MILVDSFLELMDRGGPVMWVIFFTAWVSLVLLVERTLRVQGWLGKALRDQAGFDRSGDYRPALKGKNGSPIALMLNQLNWQEVNTRSDLAKQMNIHLAELMPKLEGGIPTIAILGSLLPMLGLLGTVTGMIDVFQAIALHGTGNADEMANGISQALLTTATGLIIAIPVIFLHHLLVRRLRLLLAVTEQSMLAVYNHGAQILKEHA